MGNSDKDNNSNHNTIVRLGDLSPASAVAAQLCGQLLLFGSPLDDMLPLVVFPSPDATDISMCPLRKGFRK